MQLKQKRYLYIAVFALLTQPVTAQDTITFGAIATLEGTFNIAGKDGIRGIEMALREFNYTAGGKTIELIKRSSDASPDSAIEAARDLVENEQVPIIIGPLSGSEGLAVKDYAKTQPNVTFLNGSSAAQDTTLRDSSDNFFRFSTEGAQWVAGLGEYIYEEKGYRNIAVVAEDYSFPHTQVFGLLEPFCRLGGTAPLEARFWVPLGTHDYTSVIEAIPDDIDAIFVALGGTDAVQFISQYDDAGGDLPLVGSSVTLDQTVLNSKGSMRAFVIGTPSAGPISDTWGDPLWTDFVDAYVDAFPDGLGSPSIFAHAYYVNTKAALLALDAIGGDLSDGGIHYREALSNLDFQTPTGRVHLDARRNAVANIFLTEVVVGIDGTLENETIEVIPQVTQTLGMDYEQFLKYGPVGRNNPTCEITTTSSED